LQTDEWELPLNFRVGLAYDVIKSDMHRLLLAVDAMHPSDDYESLNVGGEYTFNDMFSIRGGMKSIFLEDSEESFAVGVGIKQMLLGNLTFKIDYSYSDFGRLKDVQKFSLTVMF
jgi:opacity protein-like surface antigen